MTKFDEKFLERLQSALDKGKSAFEKETKLLLNDSLSTHFRCICYELSSNYNSLKLDSLKGENIIHSNIIKKGNGVLKRRLDLSSNSFYDNEIFFDIIVDSVPDWESDNYFNYIFYNNKTQYNCKEEFFTKEENLKTFTSLSSFNCFVDVIAPSEIINKEVKKAYNANVEGWIKYHEEILSNKLFDIGFKAEKENSMVRFTKPVYKDVYLGIEYDESLYRKKLKDGMPCLPDNYNIIVFNEEINRDLTPNNYYTKGNNNLLCLGIYGNPLFYPPCYPLLNFCSIDMFYNENDIENSIELNYNIEFEKVDKKLSRLVRSEKYCENIKKHAFFYIETLVYSSHPFLRYIQDAIICSI